MVQDGARVPVENASNNASIAPGQSRDGMGFNATWNGVTNGRPTAISLNTTPCSITS
ncbi:MAG TPA: cellulose binding domain-containing protein [Micromonosporaceae bacterium]|nr:cellulose binding domain-containing protein [Micromonosporaceae bacterium]